MDFLKVMKANPYRESSGRFTTASRAVGGNSEHAAGAVKVDEAIHGQLGLIGESQAQNTPAPTEES